MALPGVFEACVLAEGYGLFRAWRQQAGGTLGAYSYAPGSKTGPRRVQEDVLKEAAWAFSF